MSNSSAPSLAIEQLMGMMTISSSSSHSNTIALSGTIPSKEHSPSLQDTPGGLDDSLPMHLIVSLVRTGLTARTMQMHPRCTSGFLADVLMNLMKTTGSPPRQMTTNFAETTVTSLHQTWKDSPFAQAQGSFDRVFQDVLNTHDFALRQACIKNCTKRKCSPSPAVFLPAAPDLTLPQLLKDTSQSLNAYVDSILAKHGDGPEKIFVEDASEGPGAAVPNGSDQGAIGPGVQPNNAPGIPAAASTLAERLSQLGLGTTASIVASILPQSLPRTDAHAAVASSSESTLDKRPATAQFGHPRLQQLSFSSPLGQPPSQPFAVSSSNKRKAGDEQDSSYHQVATQPFNSPYSGAPKPWQQLPKPASNAPKRLRLD